MRHAAIQATVSTAPTCPEDEIARLGDGIYKRLIRNKLRWNTKGRWSQLTLRGGNWAVAGDILEAVDRLRAQRPEAIDVWLKPCKRREWITS